MRKLLLFLPALSLALAEPAPAQGGVIPEIAVSTHAGAVGGRADFGPREASISVHSRRSGRAASRASGYWKTVRDRVWIPPQQRVIHHPAEYGFRYDSCGRRVRVCIRPARREVLCDPGRYEYRNRRVWVETPRFRRQQGARRGVGFENRRGYGRTNRVICSGPFGRW